MEEVDFVIQDELAPYVNCIMIGESTDQNAQNNIPLYADGYPGIMFQQTKNGFYLLPREKKLSELFLFGQTLQPISLDVKGPYRYVVFQLYPFASKYLLGIDPKKLNDECYDLLTIDYLDIGFYLNQLVETQILSEQVKIISNLMLALIRANKMTRNNKVQQAISLILMYKGLIKIKELLAKIHVTERTLERNFMSEVGLSPIQFAKIVQFQCSLNYLSEARFEKLIDIGFESGFTDQSHFIRTFKKYTGQTPSYYLNHIHTSE